MEKILTLPVEGVEIANSSPGNVSSWPTGMMTELASTFTTVDDGMTARMVEGPDISPLMIKQLNVVCPLNLVVTAMSRFPPLS